MNKQILNKVEKYLSEQDKNILSETIEKLPPRFKHIIIRGLDVAEKKEQQFKKRPTHWIRRLLIGDARTKLFESIENIAPHIKPIVMMALDMDMRLKEILALQWSDIKDGYVDIWAQGTHRHIAITAEVQGLLDAMPKVSKYVFINPATKRTYEHINTIWKKVVKDAKMEDLKFYDLRHTYFCLNPSPHLKNKKNLA